MLSDYMQTGGGITNAELREMFADERDEFVTDSRGRYAAKIEVTQELWQLEREYRLYAIRHLYELVTRKVAGMSIGADGYIATKYSLEAERNFYSFHSVTLLLRFDCFVIPEKVHELRVYVPSFTNDKEWGCGYCGTPQPFANRSCDKCGAPRAQLIQEYWKTC